MPKSRSPQPLARILAADTTIAAWHARALAEAQLTTAVRRRLPRAIADRVRVAEAALPTLTLATNSGAVAAVVRQRLPDILGELAREGCNFTEIRVRVQVRTEPVPIGKPLANPVDRSSLRPLSALARTLPPGPLRAALERFVRRAG